MQLRSSLLLRLLLFFSAGSVTFCPATDWRRLQTVAHQQVLSRQVDPSIHLQSGQRDHEMLGDFFLIAQPGSPLSVFRIRSA